ncbi:MAG: hypothetical protein AB7O29_08510 [Acidimicrobiia bacterium]
MTAADAPDEQGVPSDGTTLVAVLQGYAAAGWSADFVITPEGGVSCPTCGETSPADTVGFQSVRRLEGASDPGDEIAVVAATCPRCSARGALVVHYAADASPEEAAILRRLSDERDLDSPLPAAGPPTEGPGVAGPDDRP